MAAAPSGVSETGSTRGVLPLGGLPSGSGQELDGLLAACRPVSRLGRAGLLDAQVPAFFLVQLAQVVVVAALVDLVEDAVFCESILLRRSNNGSVPLRVALDIPPRL